MNDDQDPGQESGLDPHEDERIRALLAELGTTPDATSMPPEVAARLDETLAGLVAERADDADAAASGGNVVPLRRRWASRAAAAAAAVIVVGAGGVAAANLGLFDGGASDSSTAGKAGSTAESLQDSATPPAAPDSPTGQVPAFSAADFDGDVARLLRAGGTPRTYLGKSNRVEEGATTGSLDAAACPGPQAGRGAQPIPVLYDGKPAVLLIHPVRDGERLVEAWTCAGDRVLDRTRVPATRTGAGQSSPGSTGLASPSPSP